MATDSARARLGAALVLIWLGWSALMLAFPVWSLARLPPARPDNALTWTGVATAVDPHVGRSGLDRVLAPHMAWDSEYYISIARRGYDDPDMRAVKPGSNPDMPDQDLKRRQPSWSSLNHAFFPLYPWTLRALGVPLAVLGLPSLTTAVLSGVLVSLLGTLVAMWALYDLARGGAGRGDAGRAETEGLRASVYLLIWPASVFLAQVYTEGLFLGLSFGALAFMRRRNWALAGVLGAAAVWTRSTGVLLVVPFGLTWLADGGLRELLRGQRARAFGAGLLAAAPVLAYLAWRAVLGRDFLVVETYYFGRDAFAFARSWRSLLDAWEILDGRDGVQASAYQMAEFGGVAAGLGFSLVLLRRDPILALYGLAVMFVCMTSGAALGAQRYVLSVPALFLIPARWGRSAAFDRLWTLAGTLGLAVFTLAFSAGFWAG